MKSLAELLKKQMSSHKISGEALASQVIFDAKTFINSKIDELDAKPLYLKNGVLWIGISHPAFAQELFGISDKLLKILQDKYGKKIIQKFRTKSLTLD